MKKQLIAVPLQRAEDGLKLLNYTLDPLAPPPQPPPPPPIMKWWEQTEGVIQVCNGFAVRGFVAIPVASSEAAHRLLQAPKKGQLLQSPK